MSDFGDEDPIPFGEAFGINPDGTPYEPPPAEPEPPAEPATPEPPAEPAPAEPAPAEGEETPAEAVERLYGGKYKSVEELEKAHKELTAAWDRRDPQQQPPPPEPEKPKPSPLLMGEVSEIKTQADLYAWAEADPEAAANWAMENHEALKQEQLDAVMNNWIAQQPWKAITTVQQWNAQILRDEFSERQAVQDAAYTNGMRDQGILAALAVEPMMAQYQEQLSEFIQGKPQLNALVEAARTADELRDALVASFYAMAGPQIARQAMESQVERQVREQKEAEARAEAEAAAEKKTSRASTISRNTAPPPGAVEDQDQAIRDFILAGGKKR